MWAVARPGGGGMGQAGAGLGAPGIVMWLYQLFKCPVLLGQLAHCAARSP